MTQGGDINFRLYHKNQSNKDIVVVLPLDRVDSHLLMEEGQITCQNTGKCNSFTIILKY